MGLVLTVKQVPPSSQTPQSCIEFRVVTSVDLLSLPIKARPVDNRVCRMSIVVGTLGVQKSSAPGKSQQFGSTGSYDLVALCMVLLY